MTASQDAAESSAELLRHVVTVLVRDHLQVGGALGEVMVDQLFGALRRRFGGQELYIPVEDLAAQRQALIVSLFNGRNHDDVCRLVGVSRRTLYRMLSRAKSDTPPLNVAQRSRHPEHSTAQENA